MRRATAAAPLIVQDDPVSIGIEEPAVPGGATGSRTTVEDDGGLSLRITAELPVEAVAVADVELATVIALDFRVEARNWLVLALPNALAISGVAEQRPSASAC